MQKQKQYGRIVAISLLIIFTISLTSQALTQPKVGGQIVVGLAAEPRVIDATTGSWHASFVAAQIFDSLLNTDTKLNIVPSLAESWKILENEKAYMFNLRKGVVWHDGKPFGPEDVKFSFENIISKYDIFGAAYFKNAKVEIINSTAVKLKVEQLLPAVQLVLLASVDTAIVPKHILEGQDFEKSEFRTKPIGTGPFIFKEWVKGSHILLERNPNYWDSGKPYLEKVIIRFITDPMTMVSALETGEVNYVFRGLPYEAAAKLGTNPNLEVIAHSRPPYKMTLQINTNHTILRNVDVRRAISYALDRKDIVQKATLRLCIPTYRILPEVVPASPNLANYDYNIDVANRLLDEAGYPKGTDGKRFRIELLTRTGEAEEAAVADLIKDQLSKIGVEVALKRVDFGTMQDLEVKYQYDFVLVKRWVEPMWSYQLFHSSWIQPGVAFSNTMLYRNPQVDQLLDSWMREASPAKQTELLQKLEEILTSELPEIPLYDVVFLNIKSSNIKGTDIPVGRYVFWDALVNTYIYEETITSPSPTTTTVVTTTVPTTTIITTVTTTTATTTTTTTQPTQTDYSLTILVTAVIIIVAAIIVALLLKKRK